MILLEVSAPIFKFPCVSCGALVLVAGFIWLLSILVRAQAKLRGGVVRKFKKATTLTLNKRFNERNHAFRILIQYPAER